MPLVNRILKRAADVVDREVLARLDRTLAGQSDEFDVFVGEGEVLGRAQTEEVTEQVYRAGAGGEPETVVRERVTGIGVEREGPLFARVRMQDEGAFVEYRDPAADPFEGEELFLDEPGAVQVVTPGEGVSARPGTTLGIGDTTDRTSLLSFGYTPAEEVAELRREVQGKAREAVEPVAKGTTVTLAAAEAGDRLGVNVDPRELAASVAERNRDQLPDQSP